MLKFYRKVEQTQILGLKKKVKKMIINKNYGRKQIT